MSNKKILITGAGGLIGRELIKPLKKKGFEIYAISSSETNFNNEIHRMQANLFDVGMLKTIFEEVKPKYLLNLAWATTGDNLNSNINFDFTKIGLDILKYFAVNGGQRAIFVGSCFEYAFKDTPLKETDDLDPNKTTYSFCKNMLHKMAQYFCKNNDISFAYGRIFYVYGKNEDKTRLTASIIDALSKDEEIIIKSGKLYKDYMYTKDIAGAFVKLLESDVQGPINICTGKAIRIEEYARILARKLGKEDLLIFRDEASNQPPIIVGDNTRLTQEVGYQLQYDLSTAFDEILENIVGMFFSSPPTN